MGKVQLTINPFNAMDVDVGGDQLSPDEGYARLLAHYEALIRGVQDAQGGQG